MASGNTALATYDTSSFKALALPAERVQDIVDSTVVNGVRWTDLPKVSPALGGGDTWVVQEAGEKTNVQVLRGIVLAVQDYRTYYATAYDGSGSPPDCFSNDMIHGIGTPGVACATCPMNQFTTKVVKGEQKVGPKPCAEKKRVFLLQEGSLLPVVVNITPVSLANLRKFFVINGAKGLEPWAMVVEIRLAREKPGESFCRAQFKMIKELAPEEYNRVNGIRLALSPMMTLTDRRTQPEGDDEYTVPAGVEIVDGLVTVPGSADPPEFPF